jgi:hypothetical protein
MYNKIFINVTISIDDDDNSFGKENLVLIFKLINILNKGKLSIIT